MRYSYTLFFVLFSLIVVSQSFADKKHYLIDSLDLSSLSIKDSFLIEKSMKGYHGSIDDSVKLNYISSLIDDCENEEVWPKYNQWLYSLVKQNLEKQNLKQQNFYEEMLSETLNNFGYFYDQKGDVFKALEYYHESLLIKEKVKDSIGLAVLLNNIGYLYRNYGDLDKALENYQKSNLLFKDLNDLESSSIILNNIAAIYKDQNNIEKALQYNLTALKIRQELGASNLIAGSLNNLGTIYLDQKELIKARRYFSQSLEISEKHNSKLGICSGIMNIGRIDLEEDKIEEAKLKLTSSLLMAKDIGSPNRIKSASKLLSDIYTKEGNHEKALEMLNLHLLMKDSLSNQETQNAIAQDQAKYQYEKQKALDDLAHEKILAIEQAEKEKEKILRIVAVVGLILFLLFIIFLISRLRITRRQRNLIEKQKQEEREQKEIIKESHKEITDSIKYAKRLQDAVLPAEKDFEKLNKESFVFFQPKDVVSGDFYWIEKLGGKFYVAVADCTGHGVPGALVSMVCSNALNRSVKEFGLLNPNEILDKTREFVIESFSANKEDVKDGMDISLCSFDEKSINFSGANNPLWIIRRKSLLTESELERPSTIIYNEYALFELKGDKQPIGLHDQMIGFTQHKLQLYSEDSIYLFTDGFADQFGGDKGKKYRYKPLKELLLHNHQKTMIEQKQCLSTEFDSWKGEQDQIDDVCILGIRI